jgi:predicted MFS family arabinose efflux permease
MYITSKPVAAFSLYGGGFCVGLTLVSFPASSGVLKALHGFSDATYGAIYFPQLIAAIAGALLGGALASRWRLRSLYLLALVCFAAAQLCLAASARLSPDAALAAIMLGTGLFGFGFGCGGGPLNAFAALLFPTAPTTAITALHMSAGAGLTVAPFYFALLDQHGLWILGPSSLVVLTSLLLFATCVAALPEPAPQRATAAERPQASRFFWSMALVAVLYSIAEGTFSNWAILYLREGRQLTPERAAIALSCFWAALTLGRLGASFLVLRLSPARLLVLHPLLMAAAFLLLPSVSDEISADLFFAFAGLACSSFFPMLVAYAAVPYPNSISWIASMLTAAMMVGVGIGSYAMGELHAHASFETLYRLATLYPVAVLLLVLFSLRRPASIRIPT